MSELKLKLIDRIYHVDGSIGGQRIRKSLGTDNKGIARELRSQLEARLWKRHTYGEEAVRTFQEAALSYQKHGGERRFLAPLIKRFKNRSLASIKPGEITEAAFALYPTASPGTRNRQAITPARAVINHAAHLGWCASISVKSFEASDPVRTFVGREWIDAFMMQARIDDLPGLAAGMLFMFQTGARITEAAGVQPEHVDVEARTILLPKTKIERNVYRHITRELADCITRLRIPAGEPLFGFKNRFEFYPLAEDVCARAGIEYVPPHQSGRHSYATNSLAMGVGIKDAMDAGGFKSVSLFMKTYVHSRGGRVVADAFDKNRAGATPALRQVFGVKGKP
jgi:integrase